MPVDILRVKRVVENELPRIGRIGDVASRLEVSAETLRKAFIREAGLPLSDYITAQRVRRMATLLAATEKSCFLVCFEAGFHREDTGAKVFKRLMGMTMGEYRRRSRNGGR